MAVKKLKIRKIKSVKTIRQENQQKSLVKKLNLQESYGSLLLGIAVVVIVTIGVLLFAKGKNYREATLHQNQAKPQKNHFHSPISTHINKITGTTYTVQDGDELWQIAERAYGDQSKWQDIAQANQLLNPDEIYSGEILTIPR